MDFDVLIIGGGASGLMAAIGVRQFASGNRPSVAVIERMGRPGKKILASGGSRCNITNTLSNDEMMEAIHVGAAMTAGDVLAHATQMRKIIKKKEM